MIHIRYVIAYEFAPISHFAMFEGMPCGDLTAFCIWQFWIWICFSTAPSNMSSFMFLCAWARVCAHLDGTREPNLTHSIQHSKTNTYRNGSMRINSGHVMRFMIVRWRACNPSHVLFIQPETYCLYWSLDFIWINLAFLSISSTEIN